MKSPWKYPTRMSDMTKNNTAHAINREVMDDPQWRIDVCNENIGMLRKEISKNWELLDYWKQEKKEFENKLNGDLI